MTETQGPPVSLALNICECSDLMILSNHQVPILFWTVRIPRKLTMMRATGAQKVRSITVYYMTKLSKKTTTQRRSAGSRSTWTLTFFCLCVQWNYSF